MRAVTVATAVVLSCAVAAAREPRMAIAPVLTGQTCPAELQRALADELPRTLARAGFDLLPPNEVDMRIGERPEFLQCHSGGCLAEEASFLRVRRLALPRLERADNGGGFTVGMSIYDAGQKRAIADAVERVAGSNAAAQLQKALQVIATRLHSELSRPGRLEVSARPAAAVFVDGAAKGQTPWAGDLPPGDHVVALESGDARVERDVEVSPAQTAHVDISLTAPPAPGAAVTEEHDRPRHRVLRPLAWSGLVIGVVAAAAGAAMLALDGRGTCSLAPGQRECRELWDTMPAGIGLTAGGGALAVGSIVLLATDRKHP